MTYPVLGVLVGVDTPSKLRALLIAASDRCRPIACSVLESVPTPEPDAYVWCASSATPQDERPYAAWVTAEADLDSVVSTGATLLLCETLRLAHLAGERGLYVPDTTEGQCARPVLPFTRRHIRAVRGLPPVVLAQARDTAWYWDDELDEPLPTDLVDTAASCASAVVATGQASVTALSWAAPTVTDAASAASLGAEHDVHLLIAEDPDDRAAMALELARDDARAARLGWSGRLLARERTDLKHAAWTMLRRLGLPTHPFAGRLCTLEDQMDVLGTPEHSRVRFRARSLAAPLPRRLQPEGAR